MTPDEQAVRAVLGGEVRAFNGLVERHFGMVYAIAFARLANRHAAEDLTQETFLRAWLHLANLDPPSRFPAWLSQIARNLACDWLKRGQRVSAIVAKVPGRARLATSTMSWDSPATQSRA